MKKSFIAKRVSRLVVQKGISEYRISTELGQCKTYIGKLTSGKIYPSMPSFFALCDYFEITPIEFFDPKLNKEAVDLIHNILKLSAKDRANVVDIVNAFIHKDENPIPEEIKTLIDSDL